MASLARVSKFSVKSNPFPISVPRANNYPMGDPSPSGLRRRGSKTRTRMAAVKSVIKNNAAIKRMTVAMTAGLRNRGEGKGGLMHTSIDAYELIIEKK